jgi:hypothetical protein
MQENLLDSTKHSVMSFRHMNAIMLTAPAAAEVIEPEFATIPNTRKLSGLSRSTLYELESEGEIRFIRVRKRGNMRGRVLVDLSSVRKFLNGCYEGKFRGAKEKGE